MRNYFAIAFTCVYLTLTVGVAKTTHYCMGRENSTSLFSFEADKCICALFAKESKSCCNDRHEFISIDDDQASSQIIQSPAPQFNLIGELKLLVELKPSESAQIIFGAVEVKPPPPKVPLYQSYCTLVFYESIA